MKNLVKILTMVISLSAFLIAADATIVITPNDVPKGAYTNGSDEQVFIQHISITDIGGGTDISGGTITITLPTYMTIANTDPESDVLYTDEVAIAYTTALTPTWSVTAADANSIELTAAVAANTGDADYLWVFFPVETDAEATTGSQNYTFTYTGANLLTDIGAASQTSAISYEDTLANLTFTVAFNDAADNTVETTPKGDFYPAVTDAVVTLNLPDLIEDDAGGAVEVLVETAANWTDWTSNNWTSGVSDDDDVEYYLWASLDPNLQKIVADDSSHRIIENDDTNGDQVWAPSYEGQDFNDGATQSGMIAADRLSEGFWYLYITSSVTCDWVLARSDSIDVRHWPVFASGNDNAGGYDLDADNFYTPGGGGDDASVTLESGGVLDKAFTPLALAGTNLNTLEFFWDLEDVDNNATVDIFLSDDDGLVETDLVLSGSQGSEVVDSVGSNSFKINTSTLYEQGAVGSFTYSIYTDTATYETPGTYYMYMVANDGKNQDVYQLVTSAAVDKQVKVLHYPYFAFDEIYTADDFTIDSGTDDYYVISWGTDIDNDKDADDNATITFYYTTSDLDAIITAAAVTSVLDGALLTDGAWTGVPGNVVQIGSTTENGDDKADNRYMWEWTAESPTLGAGPYEVIAHIQGGSDHLFVQYNSDLVPKEAGAPILVNRSFAPLHSAYFRAETPLAGETIELNGDDEIPFKWNAFDLNDADATNFTSIVMVPQGATMVADYDAIVALAGLAGGNDWYWITTLADGSASIGAAAGPLAESGTYTLDVADLTDNIGLAAASRPQGFYDVYYMINWTGATLDAEVPVQAPGVLKFTGSDPDVTSFSLSPSNATLEEGDTLTVSVIAQSNGALLVEILNLAIDVPSTYFSVIDQGTNQPFITEAANYDGTVSKNKITTGSGVYELDYAELGQSAGDDLNAPDLTVAQFQIVATSSGTGTELIDNLVLFVNTDTRATSIVDANSNTEASTFPSEAGNYITAPRGGISGQIELEATTDVGKTVDVFVLPLGSYTAITDSDFLNDNGGANSDGSISVVLGTDGAYTVSSIPTGDYDILVHNDYRLDQLSQNVAVRPVNTGSLDFTAGDMLLAGDIAGYDHDGIGSTATQPDNQVNSDDVTAVTNAYGSTSSDTNWYAQADIDGSGQVYIADYNIVNANSGTNGEGLVYKRTAPAPNTGVIARLIALEEQGDVTTYAVALEELGNLHAYSVDMDINKAHWEVLSFSDALAGYHPARKLRVDQGSRTILASAMIGRDGDVTDRELNLFTIQLRARTKDPEAISIEQVTLVGVDYVVAKAVVEVQKAIPAEYALSQNYPNPFNPVTTIDFNLPEDGMVKISVFNLLGQEVRTLVSSRLEAGSYKTTWNSLDNNGRKVSTGMYFYRLQVDSKIVSMKKMVLLK